MNVFLKRMKTDINFCNSILRALKKLNDNVKDLILPQMKENKDFPNALSEYLINTKIQDLVGDGFILLVEIFSTTNFKSVSNDKFINVLFDDL